MNLSATEAYPRKSTGWSFTPRDADPCCDRPRTDRRLAGLAVLLFALLASLPAPSAWGGPGPAYTYGESWWQEYESDDKTALLLHFGPPTTSTRAHLVQNLDARKKEDDLLAPETAKPGGTPPGSPELPVFAPGEMQRPPVDEGTLPRGIVQDYSNARQQVKLGEGMSVVPSGRFGAGLQMEGKGGLVFRATGIQSVECWMKIASLPKAETCVFAVANDQSRLLLRPDGRIELRLKNPHGIYDRTKLGPATIAAFEQRDAVIESPEPIPLGEWTHVLIRSQPHPMPNVAPWDVRLVINGTDVDGYCSEPGNLGDDFFGRGATSIVVGDSAAGGQPFTGVLDEVRVCTSVRDFYERPRLAWRDAALARPLQFDKPWFRADSTVVHASLDHGTKLDLDKASGGGIELQLRGEKLDGLLVDGIRGKGWVMDPDIGFARVPLKGMTARKGALEFWLRPDNWDDCTGYWQHSPPPNLNLSVARVFSKTAIGTEKLAFNVTLPRGYNLERARIPIDPGHWTHLVLVWDDISWRLHAGDRIISGGKRTDSPDLEAGLTTVEFGIPDKVTVRRNEAPRIEIDEVVGYSAPLRADEVAQAQKRWMGQLEPIALFNDSFRYKWSLGKLEFSLVPLLPEGIAPALCSVALYDRTARGGAIIGPLESAQLVKDAFQFVMQDGHPLPYGDYQFRFQVKDAAGKVVVDGTRDWKFEEEPWRHSRAGILDQTPAPWTPIKAGADQLETRMTKYVFGADGLPREIHADGVNILQAPLQILENGRPMSGKITTPINGKDVEADWASVFTGSTCDITMQCRAEYDGMIRYELAIQPKGRVGKLAFVMPVKAAHATRWLAYAVGNRGVQTGEIGAADGIAITSRADPAPYPVWKAFGEERKKSPQRTWDEYWQPIRTHTEAYGFYTHADLNDGNRGLWWFCDNAAGWSQSKTQGAVEIIRQGDAVSLVLNLVAEPSDYQPSRPIVFGILPHPARPMPEKYRLFNKGADVDPRLGDIYDAFLPWTPDPRDHAMKLYPAPDPKHPADGPSWTYAESCIPGMKSVKSKGLRTLYLSRAWFSARAGAYDTWEWRSGLTSEASLTPSFNNYLCWEMNEWIGRDIWDAIYLDECYEEPMKNLEAGFSVLLPDGTEQPGVCNFMFRDLMKRWRNIFHQHGKEPMLIGHHTASWQYQGLVFCDSTLDGENTPIVSLNSRDWIDSTSRNRFEVLQNGRLWGLATFYMPFIAEGGFDNKTKSQFLRWQWRMARQAQSEFAHYETATVYEGQGSQVYKAYWKDLLGWGAGDATTVRFHPYWDNRQYLKVDDQGGETLVSLYHQPGRALVIASNRRKAAHEIRIALDLPALGLQGKLTAKPLDSSYEPPKGDDFTSGKAIDTEIRQAFGDILEVTSEEKTRSKQVDDLLDGLKPKTDTTTPRLEGNTLVIPVRARDYRVIAVE